MNEKYPAILLFGAPGSGKGTVGRKLAVVTEQYHLSSGDVFRGIEPDSKRGKILREYSDKGLLVPDKITMELIVNYIQGLILTNRFYPEKQHMILDGFPRTVPQAELIASHLEVKKIIILDVPNERVLIERIKLRAQKEGRFDDMDDAILRKRMEVYHTQTKEVLAYFPKEVQIRIDGDQTPSEVFRDVMIEVAKFF